MRPSVTSASVLSLVRRRSRCGMARGRSQPVLDSMLGARYSIWCDVGKRKKRTTTMTTSLTASPLCVHRCEDTDFSAWSRDPADTAMRCFHDLVLSLDAMHLQAPSSSSIQPPRRDEGALRHGQNRTRHRRLPKRLYAPRRRAGRAERGRGVACHPRDAG